MALSHDWPSFMAMLQRIRYRDGKIGVTTRNHYTEADWNVSNRWLVHDITAELGGDKAVKYDEKIDRAAFFKSRYGLTVDVPVEELRDVYIPFRDTTVVESRLQDGDFVNVVRAVRKKDDKGKEIAAGEPFVGHVGMVVNGPDGVVNMIHSIDAEVREEPVVDFIARSNEDRDEKIKAGKPVLMGFKFLRLEDDPLANLRKIDGDDAPRVTLPRGGRAKF